MINNQNIFWFLTVQNASPVILFHPPYLHTFYGYWALQPFVLALFHCPVGFSSCPVFPLFYPLRANLHDWNQDENFCTQTTQLWMQPVPLLQTLTLKWVVKSKLPSSGRDISWCYTYLSAVQFKVQKSPKVLPCWVQHRRISPGTSATHITSFVRRKCVQHMSLQSIVSLVSCTLFLDTQ